MKIEAKSGLWYEVRRDTHKLKVKNPFGDQSNYGSKILDLSTSTANRICSNFLWHSDDKTIYSLDTQPPELEDRDGEQNEALIIQREMDDVYQDFSNAFDTVYHSILLEKLAVRGLDRCMLCWKKKKTLDSQAQRKVMDGAASSWQLVTSGVP
ncbi:hypothetical protein HGM15179_001363 [Zosterops borbonicus]|uniref:Reverse transcriptase domain-containing protein n=1 Tax=Zosterops borbonicus TaxID=364589 RepID=A0A8K1GXC4_9PASS|nr:hypothetical protein HGM15179_001363 [Zosterops borbonicus]